MSASSRLEALLACAFLAACASTPAPRYYVLEAARSRAPVVESSLHVVVDPVYIPQEVDRPQMVLARGRGEVAIDDAHRWAAPLQLEITEVLARDLGAALGDAASVTTEPDTSSWRGYRVQVRILEFRSRLGGQAEVEAQWEVSRAGMGRHGATRLREPALASYDGLVQAHSRALERLAQAIGADLRSLDSDGRRARAGFANEAR